MIVLDIDGSPLQRTWKPLRAELVWSDALSAHMEPSDMPAHGHHLLFVHRPALEALEDLLSPGCEILPLDCDEAELWMVNPVVLLDGALDHDRSDIAFFRDGERIMRIDRYEFVPEVVADVPIFKLAERRRGPALIGDAIVQRVVEAELRNVAFKVVWDPAEPALR